MLQPMLSLVGAGPGDPDLITLKAIKALRAADVILYDALANEELLQYARPEALCLSVGKEPGAMPCRRRRSTASSCIMRFRTGM